MVLLGIWRSPAGRAWIDDAELTEIGMINVLRRPGCPLSVRSAADDTAYVEGVDFMPIQDRYLGVSKGYPGTYDHHHAEPNIMMLNDAPDGTRLLVSYYHARIIHEDQVDCCMSEQKVYDVFQSQVQNLTDFFGSLGFVPQRYLLAYSELRTGGSCATCKATGKTAGEMVADSFRRLGGTVHASNPEAELIVWHDMFAPESNAHDDYYLIDGSLEGSWEGLDQDVVICNWSHKQRQDTLPFFADRGHRQIVSANFDPVTDAPAFFESWWDEITRTPDVRGIMFTTWDDRYDELATFATLLQEVAPPDWMGTPGE